MKKPGRKLQKRTMGLLRNLMILGVSFVGLTVVLQLEIEYNLLVLIYALSADVYKRQMLILSTVWARA